MDTAENYGTGETKVQNPYLTEPATVNGESGAVQNPYLAEPVPVDADNVPLKNPYLTEAPAEESAAAQESYGTEPVAEGGETQTPQGGSDTQPDAQSAGALTDEDTASGISVQTAPGTAEGAGDGKKRKKKRIRSFLTGLLIVLAILAVCVGANVWYSRTHYKIVFYQDDSPYVTDNIRVVFITDLHSRQYGKDNEKLLADVRALKPDVILLGGDMINRGDTDYTPVLDLCGRLSQIAPLYGVLGNHESERMYTQATKDTELVNRFEQAGVTILRTESELIRLEGGMIQLIGTEGTADGFEQHGAREQMDAMELRKDTYTILMAHIPILFKDKLSVYPFDMGFAGHVHGGIVRLPGIGGLYSDEEGFFPEFDRGEYLLKNGGELIISGGLGDSSALPRINNTPELIVLDVNWCRE